MQDPQLAPRGSLGPRPLQDKHWNAVFAPRSFRLESHLSSAVVVSGRPVLLQHVVDTLKNRAYTDGLYIEDHTLGYGPPPKGNSSLVSFEEKANDVSGLCFVLQYDWSPH